MSTLRNKVQLIGNLGNDPEIVTVASGRKLAKFSMATNESYKNNKGERMTDTQWHHVIAWGKNRRTNRALFGQRQRSCSGRQTRYPILG